MSKLDADDDDDSSEQFNARENSISRYVHYLATYNSSN